MTLSLSLLLSQKYTAEFGKNYTSAAEVHRRRSIFEQVCSCDIFLAASNKILFSPHQNLARIIAHNKDTTKTWKEGVNHMTDWSEEEVRTRGGDVGEAFP